MTPNKTKKKSFLVKYLEGDALKKEDKKLFEKSPKMKKHNKMIEG